MKDALRADVLRRLGEFEFKKQGTDWLRGGTCPACHKKELYVSAETPWVVRCGRLDKCGWEGHVKELYPDLFTDWSTRAAPRIATNPNAAADDYLEMARGFDLSRIKGWYRQESYYSAEADNGKGAGSATVRFPVRDTYWERIIDKPERFGKRKANFGHGGSYKGWWWCPPSLELSEVPKDLWLVEGVFDAIALWMKGIPAVALLSCNNYPEHALADLRTALAVRGTSVRLVFGFDADKAGIGFSIRYVERARKEGWDCTAAQALQQGKGKTDWNDLFQRDRLGAEQLEQYLYLGALLVATTATEKALLIYNRAKEGSEFPFDYRRRLYWFKLNLEAFDKAMREAEDKATSVDQLEEKRQKALQASGQVRPIASCKPTALYYQRNALTDESWYYFRVEFPHDAPEIRGTFTSSQLSASAEFKKRLLHLAPGALFEGTSQMLDRMMGRQLYNIQRVETIDYIGYSKEHGAWLLGDVAVKDGRLHEINAEDFFHLGKLSLKSLNQSVALSINTTAQDYRADWVALLWECFGAKGFAALAYWLGSLYAEQIRASQKSFPFLEIVGEAGAGKSTLIEFMWKLCGRRDYEGFDPSKSSLAARARNFAQVSNLPVVLIESDRERMSGDKTHTKAFDWDELKTAFNGRSVRARGMATGGNETYEPPFRGAIVISQNADVSASDAILQRIVHLTFDRSAQTPKSREAAIRLEGLPIEQVSGFILRAAQAEGAVMDIVNRSTVHYEIELQNRPEIKSTRIAKNHAQLLALSDALRKVVNITDEQHAQVQDQIRTMACERQQAISSDHPLVQEFWESFDYIDGLGTTYVTTGRVDARPLLNHSRDENQVAVNLNEYVEKAALHRQQIPAIGDLKKVLRTSKSPRFVTVKAVNSAIRTRDETGLEPGKTVYCWVFDRSGTPTTSRKA